ncbi:hypothetical protein CDD82_7670 [Ophiocordyceps australis]|uniref:Carnitine O-acetyltransferase, mitochondrial n=1 Tax=Ophiocordyceps australis TaxID=1399860 RepID=A0A2C5YQG1_9HYPO|nr:hypothetical protein CDD82_7670 [Ophiocordyceps australis]
MGPSSHRNSSSSSSSSNSSLPPGYIEDPARGAMLRFQDSLPRLPVPSLQDTAKRYLKSLHPLLTQTEFEASNAAVTEFIQPNGPGAKLQDRLLAKSQKDKNWLYEWWNDAAYLSYRDPVVPYVSYFYSHRDDRRRRDPAKRAAAISAAVLEFKKLVDSGALEPEYMKRLPLCMDSYQWMFNACRVASRPVDYPVKFSSEHHKHIIAVRNNNFFKILHEVDGKPLNPAELETQFRRTYEMAAAKPGPPLGILTSQNRDVWADARQMLLQAAPNNPAALEAIESASFLVCLDDAAPVTLEERAHQYWHGDGANRWFDKPLQFIVNDNGTSGFMGEHSMMDGTPTHRLNDYVNDLIFSGKINLDGFSTRSNLPDPQPLRFVVSAQLQKAMECATVEFDRVISQHQLAVQAYQGYGKGLIKKFRFSPDAYVQMIIQLAYFKMHGCSRPTYESAATRRFQLGRTETCRSVSDESVAWCTAMCDSAALDADRVTLLRKAINAHIEYITAASDGKGVDRHLFGLKKLLQPGEEVPALYQDPAYAYSSSWYLSTSQLSSEFFNGYGWSQVIDGGFGIAYMINENSINFNIVSKCLGSDRMSHYLAEAASEMRDLLMPTLDLPKAKL